MLEFLPSSAAAARFTRRPRRLGAPRRRLGVALRWIGCLALTPLAGARAAGAPEYALKAALLFHFTQFVDWQPGAFSSPEAPFVIGVYGTDPFGRVLQDLVRHEAVAGHPMVVERCHTTAAARRCHIVFIASSEQDDFAAVLRGLAGAPVLTVADFPGFSRRGGMVGLVTGRDGRVHLQIAPAAARAAGLTISAKLLRVAELVPAPAS